MVQVAHFTSWSSEPHGMTDGLCCTINRVSALFYTPAVLARSDRLSRARKGHVAVADDGIVSIDRSDLPPAKVEGTFTIALA